MHSSTCTFIFFVLEIFITNILFSQGNDEHPTSHGVNHCCSFPCQNGGICMTKGYKDYECDCTGLDYFGRNCERPTFWGLIKQLFTPRKETVHHVLTHYPTLWSIVNTITPLHQRIMKYIYTSRSNQIDTPPRFESYHSYVTLDASYNTSYYGRTLPPVPRNCPTPMGTIGKKHLPDTDDLIKQFFDRKKFIPDPHNTNLLFAYYAQHFTHQFFRTDWNAGPGFTLGNEGVDLSHIYGNDIETQRTLRNFTKGKLKSQIINGEEYPPYIKDAPVETTFPENISEYNKFALGHPFFALLPGLFVLSTIWIREHNRVCDILAEEHPEWNDEQLFQTTRLIILGETIKIIIEDYVQHLSQYKLKLTFEPQLLHDIDFPYSNRIRVEFNHLYHWHPIFPDGMNLNGTFITLESMLYRTGDVLKYGLTTYVHAMINQQAGALTHHNQAALLHPVLKNVIEHGRELRLQPLNRYRERFGMEPFGSFYELTGDQALADELEKLYGSINAMEFYPGLLLEKPGVSVTPATMVEIGGPYSVKGLMSNPICSPQYWKPSTFGGERGFSIIKTASLKKLFCENLKGQCPNISFMVSQEKQLDSRYYNKGEL